MGLGDLMDDLDDEGGAGGAGGDAPKERAPKENVATLAATHGVAAETIDHWATIFRSIDADGGGSLDKSELQRAFAALGRNMTIEEAAEMINAGDLDGTGEMDFDEVSGSRG